MAAAESLIFITGGVRSGKSSFAERKAEQIASETNGQLIYLATGVPSDVEMVERIYKHQLTRAHSEFRWNTIEKSVQIGEVAENFSGHEIILLDCVTTLLNNELFSSKGEWNSTFLEMVVEAIVTGIIDIKNRAKTLIVVSNEVLFEPVNGNHLVFTYSRLLGHIHQQLVTEADQAYLVESGIPLVMKGMIE